MTGPGSVVDADAFDGKEVRKRFPALLQEVHGEPLVYLDNAATTHKPEHVIEAVADHDRRDNANVHRGVHRLSQRATDKFETARDTVRDFLGADHAEEIVWTRGTTEAVNLVADTLARTEIGTGDEILVTELEHHSNIVPWQRVREDTGAKLRVADVTEDGQVDLADVEARLSEDTAVVAVTHVSNALGTIVPVQRITELAHEHDAYVLVDGAQAAPHVPVDVTEIGCDFYAFSGHKVYGPTGIGALYGRRELLDRLEPYQGGGEMIRNVTFEETEFAEIPQKFEAGTPNITGAIGVAAALEFVDEQGIETVRAHEERVLEAATERVGAIDGVEVVGTADDKAGVLSFVIEDVHPHDIGTVLDRAGVAVRAGHHCAQPTMDRFEVPATCRASFAMYNTVEETSVLADAVRDAIQIFER